MAKKIAIDLGSQRTRAYIPKNGIVLDQPTCAAIGLADNELYAIGEGANAFAKKTPGALSVLSPVSADGILSTEMTADIIFGLLEESIPKFNPSSYDVLISIPTDSDKADESDYYEVLNNIGFHRVSSTRSCHALRAWTGGNRGLYFAVNCGASRSEALLLSDGNIINSVTTYYAGDSADAAIATYFKERYNVYVSAETVKSLKHEYAFAYSQLAGETDIICRNLSTGLPVSVHVTGAELAAAIDPTVVGIADMLVSVLESVSAEVLDEIYKTGISLCGGFAALEGLAERLTRETGVTVKKEASPEHCLIKGLGRILADPIEYESDVNRI